VNKNYKYISCHVPDFLWHSPPFSDILYHSLPFSDIPRQFPSDFIVFHHHSVIILSFRYFRYISYFSVYPWFSVYSPFIHVYLSFHPSDVHISLFGSVFSEISPHLFLGYSPCTLVMFWPFHSPFRLITRLSHLTSTFVN
jgi:hypothetical protein